MIKTNSKIIKARRRKLFFRKVVKALSLKSILANLLIYALFVICMEIGFSLTF